MLTWGSKFFFAVAGFALFGAIVYGLVTGGQPIGVVSGGYKGGVGDHLGYTILVAVSLTALALAVTTIITRDGDADTMAARAGVSSVPDLMPPAGSSIWAPVAAFGVAAIIIGVAVSQAFFILGLAVLFVVGLQWVVLAWSDRATGDPEVNEVIRRRVLGPIEIPMMACLAIAVVAIAISRVFLASGKIGAVVAGSIVAIVVFFGAVALSKIDLKRNALNGIVAIGAVLVLAGGIIGAAIGPAEHGEEHGDDHSDEEHSEDGEG